jgi:predicted GNAT family acetyltransferase
MTRTLSTSTPARVICTSAGCRAATTLRARSLHGRTPATRVSRGSSVPSADGTTPSSAGQGAEGDALSISDNPPEHRYEARIGQDVIGFMDYHLKPGLITLMHTEVDRAAEGKGVGSQLAAAALEDIRSRGLSILALCPFVRAYIRRHPEYADLVVSK